MLFGGNGGGGDVAAIVRSGMHGEAAPAGADLHHAIARAEPQLLADAVQLAPRGQFERFAFIGEQRRGVHQVRRQEQGEEVVAEIVVRGDVAAAAFTAVAAQAVPAAQQPTADAGRAVFHAVEKIAVASHLRRRCLARRPSCRTPGRRW
ncbi:hypothetical protein G6F50_014958 [Rhizopus delemar]|uniref:Uncharacterized protein n=1 Tax=Rhizopus delemar TaxID=936053 RepID=A0A9P6Y0W8_9FUNG|nr:hypothetical protein G6F50_014958 [Rhizopus delemar]